MMQRYLVPIGVVLLCSLFLYATPVKAQGTIAGRVTEAATGAPLPGANVVVEGTTIGASTNADGRFRLRGVPTGSQTILVSFVGFEPAEATLTVDANSTVEKNFALQSQTLQSGEVIVTGIRRSQSRAISQKRQALNVVDVLSADDIGNIPDRNVAEAVQRLPGIVLRNDRTEGRFVSIRGSAANLNNVTLNGHSMASTAGSRATALDLLPADMVSNIEVVKAVTPDMDGNAIGGSIDISTLTAFDRDGSFVVGSASALRHDQQFSGLRDKTFPFRANVTAGTQLGANDQFGVVVSASSSRRDFKSSGQTGGGWDFAQETGLPTTNIPLSQEQRVESNRRSRLALNGSFDWRLSRQTSVYVRPYYTYNDEDQLDTETEYNIGALDPENVELTRTGARFPLGFAESDLEQRDEEESLWGTSAGVEHEFGNSVSWSANATYSRGVLDGTVSTSEFVTGLSERASGVADMSSFLFDFYPEDPQWVGDGSNYVNNRMEVAYQENTENTYSVKTDVQIPFAARGASGSIKTGGKFERRDKGVEYARLEFDYEGDGSLTLADYAAPSIRTAQIGHSIFPLADTEAFVDDFLSTICNLSVENPFSGERSCQNANTPFVLNESETAEQDVENDSNNEENIYAGYAMGTARFGPVTALAGVRVEHTSTSSTRFQLLAEEGLETTTQIFENTYTDVLPSVHVTYNVSADLKLRGAWSNTIGRPDYDDLSSFSNVQIGRGDLGGLVASVSEGNPNLEPYRATNVDLTAEYYFRNGGLAAVSGFYKRIDNPIYRFTSTEQNVQNPFGDGRTFDRVIRTQERNADPGTILGLEATYQQPFTFLPAPFDGLGLNSNLTITDSEVGVPSRDGEEFSFFEQADLVYNMIPYFQKSGFEARVAFNYRGDYLLGVSNSPLLDAYVDDRTTVDVTARYQFVGLLAQPTLMVQVNNATNEPEVSYTGQEDRLRSHYLSGRTVTLGLSVNL
ncbi:MAG: TonB-dependent receptor [Bacteroidetes bacterium]|jgi:TonB-dependent receptor|nr:TonB-dependent receptor [Bacteroidota bacterium]